MVCSYLCKAGICLLRQDPKGGGDPASNHFNPLGGFLKIIKVIDFKHIVFTDYRLKALR